MKIYGIVTDAIKEKPLAKSKVVLYAGEIELVTFYSDKDGKFEIEQKLDQYIGKTLICHVEKDKFNSRKVTYKIGEEDIRLNIELVQDSKPNKWLKIAIAVGALIVVGIVVNHFIKNKSVIENPEIISFDAKPSRITKGNSSILSWQTSKAKKVEIIEIGIMKSSGSRNVSPSKTTTYTLIARNEKGKGVGRKVKVSVLTPEFRFRVTKASLKANPAMYNGHCPKTIRFEGTITANGKGIVQYKFVRSDGITSRAQSLQFNTAGSQEVNTAWELDRRYSGWQAISILSPQEMRSNQAKFKVICDHHFKVD